MDRNGQINIDFTKAIDLGSRRLKKGTVEAVSYKDFFEVNLIQQDKEP